MNTMSDLTAAATTILEACKLKRFTIHEERLLSVAEQKLAFAQLLAAHRELEYFKFQQQCYYCVVPPGTCTAYGRQKMSRKTS